jgi:two-component system, OmpR family, response regulator
MVVNYLEAHQMRALSAPGREAMMSHLAQSEPDLAILELRLGQDNGLDLLRDIRSRTDVPVIIVADERRDEIDRVVGLELGADDCVTTPFGIRELLARVQAVLRRNARRLAPPRDPARGRCRFGAWQLGRKRVKWRVGQRQRLIPSSGQETIYGGSLRTIIKPAFCPQRRSAGRACLTCVLHRKRTSPVGSMVAMSNRRHAASPPDAPRRGKYIRRLSLMFSKYKLG